MVNKELNSSMTSNVSQKRTPSKILEEDLESILKYIYISFPNIKLQLISLKVSICFTGKKFSTEGTTELSEMKMQQPESSYFVRITTHISESG